MFESEVFNRQEAVGPVISENLYNLAIGMVLCWGFGINWWMVSAIPVDQILSISPIVFYIGYFASCFLGVYLFTKSDHPGISFLGYNFVVIPFGFIINIVVANYDQNIVADAIKVTGLVTAVMMLLGTLFPKFFQKISGVLTISLIVVILVEMFQVFILGIHQGWLDWVVVLIFCGYIGYDWGRANQIPKTLDNAVDSAASLYMDIINLFIRILRIMGKRD